MGRLIFGFYMEISPKTQAMELNRMIRIKMGAKYFMNTLYILR